MKVFGVVSSSTMAMVLVLIMIVMINVSQGRQNEGPPPPPGQVNFMMNDPPKPDTPEGLDDGAPGNSRIRRQMPSPPMPDHMPMPGGRK